jgi:serine/threonine protein kinase
VQSEQSPIAKDPNVGRRLGDYEVIERIGEGGMGVVYLARRAGADEPVALKLIKRGMGTDMFLRRFQNERRILAAMKHPNIAALIDAGAAADGLPYFVMEYVAGRPLREYCDSQRLTIEERLRLFQKICSAVGSAHERRVIHRDLKPANILVTAGGEPKLLDFGIAKILDGDLTQLTITLAPVMTPHYASPEQTQGQRLTAASDIYSLGVLLYELLTGRLPYVTADRSASSVIEAIRTHRPKPPSSLFPRTGAPDPASATVTEKCSSTPSEMRRKLHGGLDAITMIALQKVPADRYPSCADFAADIEHYLHGERVLGVSRRREHRWRWIAAASVLIAIAGATAYLRPAARLARLTAPPQAADSGFENLFPDSARKSPPQSAVARRLYVDALVRLRSFDTLAARDLLRNAVTAAPEHALSHAALAAVCNLLGYDMEARDEARKALELSTNLTRQDRLSIEGGYYETSRAWDRAVGAFRTLRREFPDNLEYGLRLANAQTQAGDGRGALETIRGLRSLAAGKDLRLGLAESEAALAISDLTHAQDAAKRVAQAGAQQGLRILAARAFSVESRIAISRGDPQRALAAAAEAQKLYQATGHRQGMAWALNDSAAVLTQLGDVDGARAHYEEALAVCRTIQDQTCIGTDLDSIGVLRRRQGDLKGALEMHEKALEIRRAVSDRAGVAMALYNLANVLETLGDLTRAQQAISEALDLRGQLGETRNAALTLSRLANIRRRQGAMAESLRINQQAVNDIRAVGDRGGVAMALANFGMVLRDHGELSRSRSVLEDALAIRRQQRDKNNISQVLAAQAAVSLEQDRIPEARKQISESISIRQQLGEKISLGQSKLVLADILIEEGQPAAAEAAAREAANRFQDGRAPILEGAAHLAIARSYIARGNASQAKEAYESANRLLHGSQEVSVALARDIVRARIEGALGRMKEASAALDGALGEAHRFDLTSAQFEIRLAILELTRSGGPSLVSDARRSGFLRIARKAASL